MQNSTTLSFQHLDVYREAKQLAVVVHSARIADAELRDQATRAAKSTFLRLVEGLPHVSVAMRRKFFREAKGSLYETIAAVDLAAAIGAAKPEDAEAVQALGNRVGGMLHRLLQ